MKHDEELLARGHYSRLGAQRLVCGASHHVVASPANLAIDEVGGLGEDHAHRASRALDTFKAPADVEEDKPACIIDARVWNGQICPGEAKRAPSRLHAEPAV